MKSTDPANPPKIIWNVHLYHEAGQLKQENKVLNIRFDQFIYLVLCSAEKRQSLRNS